MQGSPPRQSRRSRRSRHCGGTRIRLGIRFLWGLLLIPVIGIVASALVDLLYGLPLPEGQPASTAFFLAAGYGAWLLLFLLAPPPVRTYVLAHELTHAVWGLFWGAQIRRLRVTRSGGSVTLSHTNTLILLAPYFFPLYTILLLLVRWMVALVVDPHPDHPLWMAAIGFTWGFHFTFTVRSLLQRQTDVEACGRLFALTLIVILNLLGITIWIVGSTEAAPIDLLRALENRSGQVIRFLSTHLKIFFLLFLQFLRGRTV